MWCLWSKIWQHFHLTLTLETRFDVFKRIDVNRAIVLKTKKIKSNFQIAFSWALKMNSVVRAGHLAPYFKSSSQVVSNSLKPIVVVATPNEKLVVQPLPKTSTVQSLHGSLPIQGLKLKVGTRGESLTVYYCVLIR